jgi:phosphoribosylanthranilate isomerase
MWVKVCGTTSEEDALLAVALGADAVGFIFAPSPRQVAAPIVADIVKRLPPEIVTVGVFRDELPQRVVTVATRIGLKAVQLHGYESPEQVRWVRQRLPMVIKAFPAGDGAVAKAANYGADAILLDAPNPGSGQVFDWAMASEVPGGQRLIVAGGLNAQNVAASIVQTHPWGVDVVSGVERSPGHKDPLKLRAFIIAAKAGQQPSDDDDDLKEMVGPEGPYDWQDRS